MNYGVLIVDDSISIARRITKLIIELQEFHVVGHAKDGAEAIKLYNTLQPDIVLMDVLMPNMDGLQALRAIKQINDKSHVIVISSVGGVGETVEHALRLGAEHVLTKPIERVKLHEVLRQTVEGE